MRVIGYVCAESPVLRAAQQQRVRVQCARLPLELVELIEDDDPSNRLGYTRALSLLQSGQVDGILIPRASPSRRGKP